MHTHLKAQTLCAALATTGVLLAGAATANAQGLPPDLPAPPTSVGDAPPDAGTPAPPPGGGQAPPAAGGQTPTPGGAGSTGPKPAIVPTPKKPVSLAGTSALRGRTLKVGLSCSQGGTVLVSYRGKRAGKAGFGCEGSRATARVRLGRRVVRQIKRSQKAALKVTARAGGTNITRVLRFSNGRAQAALWARGAHGYFSAAGYCDYSLDHQRTLYSFTGLLTSSLPGGDRYWLRFWAYTHGSGWKQMTGWLGSHEVPQEGQGGFAWASYDLFYPPKHYWTAGYMELWSYRYGRSWGDYLQADQLGGGGITVTSGAWCYPKA